MRTPKAQIILGYTEVYNEEPPSDRISLIQGIDRKHLLVEIAGLNYRIKPKRKIAYDNSEKFQLAELEYFSPTNDIYQKYLTIFDKHRNTSDGTPIYFSHQGCLFAMEEIVNCEKVTEVKGFKMAKPEIWEAILKYFLAVNSYITFYKLQDMSNPGFEELNPRLLPLNELTVETDPLYTAFRGFWLLQHLSNTSKYQDDLNLYFQETYGIAPGQFIYNLLNLYFTNEQVNEDLDFVYKPAEKALLFIEQLSRNYANTETIKLLSIRKYPLIKIDEGEFILTDAVNLIEKSYNQFLNDFWFDWLKIKTDDQGKIIYNISEYHSEFGRFFECYVKVLFDSCFSNYRHSKLLMFDDLKVPNSTGDVEIADIYLRCGNKVLIGEVKSGYIYDKAKYGGDVDALYKNDREKFFEDFGVNQVISQISKLVNNISRLDPGFPFGHQLTIYPVIVFNDKALQTPLIADVFDKRFSELTTSMKLQKMNLKPLSIIHINDLERLEKVLCESPKHIWQILYYHSKDKRFIPAFYSTVFHFLQGTKYSQRIIKLHEKLILSYGPKDDLNQLSL